LKEEAMRRTILTVALGLVVIARGRVDAHPPWGIAVDGRGRVVFADIGHGNHIWRIEAPGKLTSLVAGRHSHDLHLGRDGTLFVSHIEYIPRGERFVSRLLRIGPDGETSEVIPPTADRKRFWGNAFTLDGESNVYFGYTNNPRAGEAADESLLLKRSPDGRITVLAGSKAGHRDGKGKGAQFRAINALAWGPEGVLYVADESAIRTVARDGTVTTLARDLGAKGPNLPVGDASHLFGLAAAPDGTAYSADHGVRRIVKVTPDGRISTASESQAGWAPTGVAVSGDALYILEVGSGGPGQPTGPRVRKVSPGGKSEVLATVAD
jgi:sugar lactone lactonase YvrE